MSQNRNNDGDLRFNATLEDNVSPRVDAIIKKMQQLGASKHEIKIFVRAYDEASGKAMQVRKQLDALPKEVKTRITVTADVSHVKKALADMKKATEAPIKIGVKLSEGIEDEFTKVRNKMRSMKMEMEQSFATMPAFKMADNFGRVGANYGLAAAGLGGAGVGIAGSMFVRQAFQQNAQQEQDTVSLKSTLKDLAQAKSEMQQISQFAIRTPFNQPDVLQSDIMMRNFAINPKGPVGLKASGNLAAAFGRPQAESTQAIADAVRRGDFRMLGGFGINLHMEDFAPGGRYQGQSIQQGLGTLINQRFGGAMVAQGKTFTGLTSNLQDVANLGLIRPSGATGFGIVKGVEQNANNLMTGSGPQAMQFQRQLGKITEAIDHMSAKLYMATKQTGTYFKTYMEKPLMDFAGALKDIGMLFGQTFGSTSLTVLKTYASGLAVITNLAASLSKTPVIGGAIGGLAKVKGFAKGLDFVGMGQTAKPFNDFANDAGTFHFVRAMKDALGMAAQAPKLALFFTVKHILDFKSATDSLNSSFKSLGSSGEDALDRVNKKFDMMSMTMNENVTVLKQYGAEAANVMKNVSDPNLKGNLTIEATKNLAAAKGAGYGSTAHQLILDNAKRLGQDGFQTGDWDRASKQVIQAIDSIRDALGTDLKTAATDLSNAMSVFAEQLGAAKGQFANNPSAFAAQLSQVSKLTNQQGLSRALLTGTTPLGAVHNGDEFAKAIGTAVTNPSANLLQFLYQKNPKFSINSIETFRKNFDVWNQGSERNGKVTYTGEAARTRGLLTQESDLEKSRRDQLAAYDKGINATMAKSNLGAGTVKVNLPKPQSAFFANQVGIRTGNMTTPDGAMKEAIRLSKVVDDVTKASTDAQAKLAQLQVEQTHVEQAQASVNFQMQNFQRTLIPTQRLIQDQTMAMNQLAFSGARKLQREMDVLNNTMAVYQHKSILPIQRAQEDFSNSILKTSYALADVSHKMELAQYSIDKYGSAMLPGENAVQETIHGLDMYSKKLQLLQLQQRGMMADLTKTTFTEGFKTTIKPIMGFSLERQQQLTEMKQQRAQLESDIKYGDQHWQLDRANRSKFQKQELPFDQQMKVIKANRPEIDKGVESTHKLNEIQYKQSLTQRKLTEEMYKAQVGMRKYEDQQYSLGQKSFRVNQQLADMQDNITKLGLALDQKSTKGSRRFEDALDGLRRKAYTLNKDLIETQLLVGQLDSLPDTARQQFETVINRVMGGIIGQGPNNINNILKELFKDGLIKKDQYETYRKNMTDPTKEAAKSFKDEMNNSISSVAFSMKRMFSGLFTGNTAINVGSMVSHQLGFLPGGVGTAAGIGAGVGATAFGWNATRLATLHGVGGLLRGASWAGRQGVPGLSQIESLSAAPVDAWRNSRVWSPKAMESAPMGTGILGAWGRYFQGSAPMKTLTHPFSVAGGKGVEGVTAIGLNALGVPLPFALAGGLLSGFGYERAGGGLAGFGVRRAGNMVTGGRYSRLPNELVGPGRINALEGDLSKILPGRLGEFFDPSGGPMTKLRNATGIGIDPTKELREISERMKKFRTNLSASMDKFETNFKNAAEGAFPNIRTYLDRETGFIGNRVAKATDPVKNLLSRTRGGVADVTATASSADMAYAAAADELWTPSTSVSKLAALRSGLGKGAVGALRGLGKGTDLALKGVGKLALPATLAMGMESAAMSGNFAGGLNAVDPTTLLSMIPGLGKFKGITGTAFDVLGIGMGKGDNVKIAENFQKQAGATAGRVMNISKSFDKDPVANLKAQIKEFQNLNILSTELDPAAKKKIQAALTKEIDVRQAALDDIIVRQKNADQQLLDQQKKAHDELARRHNEYGHGLAEIQKGINTHNKKLTDQGYKDVADATGQSLDNIKALTHKKGLKTGQDYANAIKSSFKKAFGSNDLQEILDPAFNASQNTQRARNKAIDAIKGLQRVDPQAYAKKLADINAKYNVNAADPQQTKQATDNLSKKFKTIEDSTQTHLQKLSSFQDAYNKDQATKDSKYWQNQFSNRNNGFVTENNDYNRHISNVGKIINNFWGDTNADKQTNAPAMYEGGWQKIDKTTQSYIKKVDKSIKGISADLGLTTSDTSSVPNKASGGVVDGKNIGKGHLVRVGEEGFPEAIIPLAPHRRDRAKELIKQVHAHMGDTPKYANGAIVNWKAPIKGVHQGIIDAAEKVVKQFPQLFVGYTTNGGHAAGSYHYKGMAADIDGPLDVQKNASDWIIKSGLANKLTEGIHNPNLSIKYGKSVPPTFWKSEWPQHIDHIHLAVDGGDLTNLSNDAISTILNLGLGTTASLPKVPVKTLKKMGLVGAKYARMLKSLKGRWENAAGGAGSASGSFNFGSTEWHKEMAKIAKAHHWNLKDWEQIVQHESGGNPLAGGSPNSGKAWGLGQFLGGTLTSYAKYGATSYDPVKQIQAMARYIADRYGDPSKAWAGWSGNNFPGMPGVKGYASGGIITKLAGGLKHVPSNNYAALLDQGEKVMTAHEVAAADSGGKQMIELLKSIVTYTRATSESTEKASRADFVKGVRGVIDRGGNFDKALKQTAKNYTNNPYAGAQMNDKLSSESNRYDQMVAKQTFNDPRFKGMDAGKLSSYAKSQASIVSSDKTKAGKLKGTAHEKALKTYRADKSGLDAATRIIKTSQTQYTQDADRRGVSRFIQGGVLTNAGESTSLTSDKQLTAHGKFRTGTVDVTATNPTKQAVTKAKTVAKAAGYSAATKSNAASVRGQTKSVDTKTPDAIRKLSSAFTNGNNSLTSRLGNQVRHQTGVLGDILDALKGGGKKGSSTQTAFDKLTKAGQQLVKAWEKQFDKKVNKIEKTKGTDAAIKYVKEVIVALNKQGSGLKAHLSALNTKESSLKKSLAKAKEDHNSKRSKEIQDQLKKNEDHLKSTREKIAENGVKAQHARNELKELQSAHHKKVYANHKESADQRDGHHKARTADYSEKHKDKIEKAKDRLEESKNHRAAMQGKSKGEQDGRHSESKAQRGANHAESKGQRDTLHGDTKSHRNALHGDTKADVAAKHGEKLRASGSIKDASDRVRGSLDDDTQDSGGMRGRLKSVFRRIDATNDHMAELRKGFRSAYPGKGFAGGVRYVPSDNMPALLHQGEMVLQAGEANIYRAQKSGGVRVVAQNSGVSDALLGQMVAELKALNSKDTNVTVTNYAQGAALKTTAVTPSRRTR